MVELCCLCYILVELRLGLCVFVASLLGSLLGICWVRTSSLAVLVSTLAVFLLGRFGNLRSLLVGSAIITWDTFLERVVSAQATPSKGSARPGTVLSKVVRALRIGYGPKDTCEGSFAGGNLSAGWKESKRGRSRTVDG